MLNPFIDKDQKENLAHNEELKNNIQNPCEPLNYDLTNNVENIIDSYHSKNIMENRSINRYGESFTEINSLFGNVDILVNNAGIIGNSSFPNINSEDFDSVIETNLIFHIF